MGAAASTASSLPLERWTAEQRGRRAARDDAVNEAAVARFLGSAAVAGSLWALKGSEEIAAWCESRGVDASVAAALDRPRGAVEALAVPLSVFQRRVGAPLGVYRMAVAKLIRHGGFDFYRVLYRDLTASVVSPLQDWAWVRHVGAGTYGNVCAVRSLHNDSTVACKLLGCDDDARRMLGVRACTDVGDAQQEMARLTQVSSPHCVRLRQYATVAEPLILWALTDLCGRRCPAPEAAAAAGRRASSWWRDATAGLAAIHKLRVAHRDVKTENIFLHGCGTPAFLAPEILSNQPYTLKADVWSLGCVFFETVAGRPLNAMAHDDDTIVAQFREAAAARGLPGLFPRVFERILRRDPDDRPSSSDVLAAFDDDETPPLGKSGSARVAPAPPDETVAAAAWRQRQLKRRASSSKPKPPAPRPAPAPAAPKPPPSREVERLASFLKEALDDAEPPRDAAADERKARQRAAEDAKAIAELERGAASVRDFHSAPPTAAAVRERAPVPAEPDEPAAPVN
ncbi:serine/threonine kinase [Aureococcus anophagefferens]|nr:serine/threonine kinase [Aureococcus anophagefferens]